MALPSSVSVRELPLFPLPDVVLFPKGNLPLHIFELRYRRMIRALLDGDRTFGVLMWDPVKRETARTGCLAEIGRVHYLPDGRMNIFTRGSKRFRVIDVLKEKPYLVGLVQLLDDDKPDRDLTGLQEDITRLLSEIVRLSVKLTDKSIELPAGLPTSPEEFSYWIASNFYADACEQQALLELEETSVRLEKEVECLSSVVKELAARTAIKDALG
jgi:ATP-dependent Lon protease